MDSSNHFKHFLNAAADDPRIGASHISLYMALYQHWINNKCIDPFSLRRDEVMKTAKINGIATYHKCIKELNEYGYIQYLPSYRPKSNTKVYLSNFWNNETKNVN